MGKQRARTISWKKAILLCALAATFVLPVRAVLANSGPPPSVAWFSIVYETAQTPRLLGIQLIACMDANCEQPILLQQYGRCDQAGCLSSTPQLSGWNNNFACAANICRSSAYPNHSGNNFKLVAQFSDRVRSSGVVAKLPSQYGEDLSWRVSVREADLSIETGPLPAVSDRNRSFPRQPLLLFFASILVEVVVAGACFWRTVEPSHFESSLGIVFLVNLVSLPVVWFFFPSLGQFQSEANRSLGLIFLTAAFFYGALLAVIYRSGGKTRGWIIALSVLSLPFTALCALIIPSFLNGYESGSVFVQGLPANLAIAASEVFAVVFEAVLITILSKGRLPVKWIWISSLLMNAASFVTGMYLSNIISSTPREVLIPPDTPSAPTLIAANTWTSLGPVNGIVQALAVDPLNPGNLYAGLVGAGVFKSSDGGGNWMQVNNGLSDTSVYALAIDPETPTSLYAGTPSGVFKSTDGGASWSATNQGLAREGLSASVAALAIDPETTTNIYAGTASGIFKSTDGGGTWSLGTDPTQLWGVAALTIYQGSTTNLYAGAVGGVYKSTDGGRSVVNQGLHYVFSLAINTAMPGTLYAGTMEGVFKSTDGGESWSKTSNGLGQASIFALAIDPTAQDTLFAGTQQDGVFRSTNGGMTWEPLNNGLTTMKVCALLISPAMADTLYAGTNGGGVFVLKMK